VCGASCETRINLEHRPPSLSGFSIAQPIALRSSPLLQVLWELELWRGAVARDPHASLPAMLPRLVAFARTMVGDADLAPELVQEAATRALAARRVPSDPPAYRAWMFRIVRNAALDHLRRTQVRMTLSPLEEVDLWRFDDARIAKITVEQGLASLEASQREIIALIDIAGFTYMEAAQLLRVPIGTVMSRISRARAALLGAIEASAVRPLKSNHGH
jgi:RNA polymerase sigma-70 factor (ECF subfamily)